MHFLLLVSNLTIQKAFRRTDMPLPDLEVVISLILLLVLSFDRFHTGYTMFYFIALATNSG